VTPGGASQTLNFTAAAGTFSQQPQLNNLSGGGGTRYRFVTYQFTCTPTPTTGTINVVKTTTGGNGTFTFNSDIPTGSPSFPITTAGGGGSKSFSNVTPGTYHLSEAPLAGWNFGTLTCNGNTIVNGSSATITLAAGDNVTCTYSNTKQAKITV